MREGTPQVQLPELTSILFQLCSFILVLGFFSFYFLTKLLTNDFLPSTHLTILAINNISYLHPQLLSKVVVVASENFNFWNTFNSTF